MNRRQFFRKRPEQKDAVNSPRLAADASTSLRARRRGPEAAEQGISDPLQAVCVAAKVMPAANVRAQQPIAQARSDIIARRECLSFVGQIGAAGLVLATPLGTAAESGDRFGMPQRVRDVIRDYDEQGFHRTGTAVDRISGEWLAGQVREIGLDPMLDDFELSRVDPIDASVIVNGRKIEGLPLFDGGFTSSQGIRGRIGNLDSDATIGLTEIAPNAADSGALGEARRQGRHLAIVAVTHGDLPDFALATRIAFDTPLAPRSFKCRARKRRSWPIVHGKACRRCSQLMSSGRRRNRLT
jgi:hypothetical protein